jgi:putative MATE family efflux protein
MKEKGKSAELGEEPIGKLLAKLSIPATIGMLVVLLYNVVDMIFVARYVGTMAVGGMSVVLPVSMLFSTVGMSIGVGGGSMIARFLGAKEYKRANKTMGNMITLNFVLIGFATIIGFGAMDWVLKLFGAGGEIFPYAKTYFFVILIGTPLLSFAMMFNNAVRSEGKAKTAMVTMLISALMNLILDPIFIIYYDWGIAGAAWATVISQIFALGFLLWFYLSGNSSVSVHKKHWCWDGPLVKEITAIGSSSAARQGASSIASIVVNHLLLKYGGELSIAVFGIMIRIVMIAVFPLFGLAQGMMPLVGFNLGARKLGRVEQSLSRSIIIASAISFFMFLCILFFSEPLVRIFSTDPDVIAMGDIALKIINIALPFIGFQIIGAVYFQAIGKAKPAIILTVSRQLLFLVPAVLVLSAIYGLDGIWYAFPVADFLSTILVAIYILPAWRELKMKQDRVEVK